ncbi:hypothetical protein SLEP1_g41335 [Rubroshorea leprosula]|uniref:Uncharacterized protein n=1 Tax=Rubroshorea leprosula TaxID=152421 RepID=A0AAV5L6U8_9ROSI|nr:hypothetical protein SLEP1_g41335 [Rubroshorea leprosula]
MSNREKSKKIRNGLPQDAVLKAISGVKGSQYWQEVMHCF